MMVENLDFAGQDFLEPLDQRQDLVVFGDDLVALQAGQTVQAHVEDRLGLDVGEGETGHQTFLGFGGIGAGLDDLDDLVEILQGDLEPFEDVGAGLGLFQLEDAAPGDDLLAVIDEPVENLAQGQDPRLAGDDGEHDDAEGGLHLGHLVELVEDDLGDGVLLQLDDDAHAVAVRFVAQIGDPLDLLVLDQIGDLFDQAWPC